MSKGRPTKWGDPGFRAYGLTVNLGSEHRSNHTRASPQHQVQREKKMPPAGTGRGLPVGKQHYRKQTDSRNQQVQEAQPVAGSNQPVQGRGSQGKRGKLLRYFQGRSAQQSL